jgi:hypothetical protein
MFGRGDLNNQQKDISCAGEPFRSPAIGTLANPYLLILKHGVPHEKEQMAVSFVAIFGQLTADLGHVS